MKTAYQPGLFLIILTLALLLGACNAQPDRAAAGAPAETAAVLPPPYVEFTLQTVINEGKLAYIGIDGEVDGVKIDGVINPDLLVQPGDVLRLVLLNGDGMPHDLYLPDFNAKTSFVSKVGDQTEIIVEVGDVQPGTYVYYCTVPGHRQAGQEGKLIVRDST
ncbi:MAG TPA: cupredoxin domain-containing protein [Anaerolineales bacterium]|nr:cupredoxin domain-containing protein [Anaerolineales bacterium]